MCYFSSSASWTWMIEKGMKIRIKAKLMYQNQEKEINPQVLFFFNFIFKKIYVYVNSFPVLLQSHLDEILQKEGRRNIAKLLRERLATQHE